MSVFQLQEWWSINISDNEEFDAGCMAIGNIDNSNPSADKIAIGSLQGILRIYYPSRPSYRVEDLILEENLGLPILQLLIGRFIPAANILGLAVLHPKRLVVYEILPESNKDGRINYYSLRKAYTHELGVDGKHFTAYNMISGSFGSVRDRDMIAVQSLDGKIQIFEQSANAFTRQLADCLIPGPVAYIPKNDSFVTMNHACQVECYRYQVLASSQTDIGSKDTSSGSNGLRPIRSAMVEWSLNIGDPCRQIIEGFFSTSASTIDYSAVGKRSSISSGTSTPSELLILCDKSIFLVKGETGGVIQQKRLDRDDASCMCLIPPSISAKDENGFEPFNFILASQDSMIQVFSGFNLVWAAKTLSVPVQMFVSTFGNQKGLIVCIDDTGRLSINYLGTKPPVNSVMTQVRDLNYDLIEAEHKSLLQVIRETQNENKVEVVDKLFMRIQYPKSICTESASLSQQDDKIILPLDQIATLYAVSNTQLQNRNSSGMYIKILLRLYLSYSGEKDATNVSLVIDVPGFIHAVPKNIIIQRVSGVKKTPCMVKVYLYALKTQLPTSIDGTITASYISANNNEPRVTSISIQLPIYLLCKPRAPVKSSLYKVILDTDTYNAVPLTELFGDFLYAYQQAGLEVSEIVGSNATQALGFQLFPLTLLTPDQIANNKLSTASDNANEANTDNNPLPKVSNSKVSNLSNVVSILVSKTSGRYRIQADSYAAMYSIVEELEKRLNMKLNNIDLSNQTLISLNNLNLSASNMNNLSSISSQQSLVKCSDSLPLDEYFQIIESHYLTRIKLNQLLSNLNDVAHQYRMIEKRLLVRFKDRNPTALNGLDILMKETYEKIIFISDQVEESQNYLNKISTELDCFSKFLVIMSGMKYNMNILERNLLKAYLCPDLKEGIEQGWEETVNASVAYLLKSTLAKTAKDSVALGSSALQMPSFETLKKHLLIFFDRLENGGKLAYNNTSHTSIDTTTPQKPHK